MKTQASRRGLVAVGVVALGLFLGAGGFGLYRVAHAEPVPAAPPQFRPASGNLLPSHPTVPVGTETQPGDLLPVPDLPKPPPAAVEVLPPPKANRETAPVPVPVLKLPSAEAAKPVPSASPTTDPLPPVLPLPLPVDNPIPTPATESLKPALPDPPDLSLQPSEPRHNVKNVETAPAPPPVVEFPAAPAVELPTPAGRTTHPPSSGLPTLRETDATQTPSGDAPMPLTVRQTTRAAVLGAALLAFPVFADAQDTRPEDSVKPKDFETLKKEIEELRTDIKELRDAILGRADSGTANDGLLRVLQRLNTTLSNLDERLQKLGSADMQRIAGASPLAGGASPPIAGRAVVRIVNEYPIEISMLVNGIPHRIPPMLTKEVSITPGSFSYQLLTSGASEVAGVVREGETVTLRVR